MHKCNLMEKESGIMKKLKKDKKITYKMISVCLSLVMMITSFLPMTVQAAGKNEIINALSDIPATQVIIRKHCRHHFKMSNTR